jgi:hypothetical protein
MEILIIAVIVAVAVAAVIHPLVQRSATEPLEAPEPEQIDRAALESEVQRYRAALREGTLCRRCGEANPAGSQYCAQCGRALTEAA